MVLSFPLVVVDLLSTLVAGHDGAKGASVTGQRFVKRIHDRQTVLCINFGLLALSYAKLTPTQGPPSFLPPTFMFPGDNIWCAV